MYEGTGVFLGMLFGAEPEGFCELRALGKRPAQRFYPLPVGKGLWRDAEKLADHLDVYVGVAPRTREQGGKDAVARSHVLWADVDSPEAAERLASFQPASMLVSSGTEGHLHAYWALQPPVPGDYVRRLNLRLARALQSDRAATDSARILRLPGTVNHKTNTRVAVADATFAIHNPTVLVGDLPDPEPKRRPARAFDGGDPVRAIPPPLYVRHLTGQDPDRGGKVTCPLHEDWVPSLHVYREPESGWYCFQCEQGGNAYDLAAAMWNLGTRGDEFQELRLRLARELLS